MPHPVFVSKIDSQIMMTSGKQQRKTSLCQGLALLDETEVLIGARLGSGGFCHVFEAKSFDLRSDRKLPKHQEEARSALARNAKATNQPEESSSFAVKVLRPEVAHNPKSFRTAVRDIKTEAKVLSQIDHPNVIKLRGQSFDSSQEEEDNHQLFLITDRLDESLDDRIHKWKLKESRMNNPINPAFAAKFVDKQVRKQNKFMAERLQVATEIASALEYLHERRIVYRDVKPSNIGFNSNARVFGTVKLFDFGLARSLPEGASEFNDTYKMTGKVGSYGFMPPEVAMKMPYNEKADVYSYSHVLYQILALEMPYRGYSTEDHITKVIICGERPPIDPQWPEEVQELLERAWSSDTSKRPSMTEIIGILKSVISDLTESRFLHLVRHPFTSKRDSGKTQGLGGVKIQPQ